MTESDKDIWFPAKRYGWGWGFPIAWQGWAVMIGYLALLVAGGELLLPNRIALFYGFVFLLTLVLLGICYAKGEKPRWRWGGDP